MLTDSASLKDSRLNDEKNQEIQTQSQHREDLVQERSRRMDGEKIAEQERSRTDRLAERLRSLGIDPDDVV